MKWLGLAILLILPSLAGAATYYADQSAGNCTNYNPASRTCTGVGFTNRNTLAGGVALLAPGSNDTLIIRAGTWIERLLVNVSGAAGNPITVRVQTGETVVLKPVSSSQAGLEVTSSNVDIRADGGGALIVDAQDISNSNHAFIMGSTASNIRLYGVEGKDTGKNNPGSNPGAGAKVDGSNIEFHDCYMHHNGAYSTSYLFTGAQAPYGFYWAGSNGTIDNCRVMDNGGFGIQVYNLSGQPSNMTIKNSTWARNGNNFYAGDGSPGRTSAAILSYASNSNIYNNVIYNAPLQMGITVSGSNSAVFNNTVYSTGQGGIEFFNGIAVTIKNNILYDNPGSGHLVNSGGTPTYSKNLCFGTGATTSCTTTGSDPLFVNASAGDFHLQTGSPAIDAGDIPITTGISIPACSGGTTTGCYNGTLPDLGALETGVPTVAGGPPTLTPSLTTVAAGAAILLTVDDDDVNERVEDIGDWVAIFLASDVAGAIAQDWFYMNGTKTAPSVPISDAVIPFTAPSTPGAYQFRFHRNNSEADVDLLASANFTVVPAGIVMKFNITSLKIGPSVLVKIGTP